MDDEDDGSEPEEVFTPSKYRAIYLKLRETAFSYVLGYDAVAAINTYIAKTPDIFRLEGEHNRSLHLAELLNAHPETEPSILDYAVSPFEPSDEDEDPLVYNWDDVLDPRPGVWESGLSLIRWLIDNGANIQSSQKVGGVVRERNMLLSAVSGWKNLGLVRILAAAAKKRRIINDVGPDGSKFYKTPLCAALVRNDASIYEVIQILIEFGANPNTPSPNRESLDDHWVERTYEDEAPLYPLLFLLSATPGIGPDRERIAELFLQNGAEPDWHDDQHRTALFNACSRNFIQLARLLFDKHGCDPNRLVDVSKSDFYTTPFLKACGKGAIEIVEMMIKSGRVSVETAEDKRNFLRSPLYHACKGNHLRVVQTLLNNNADPNAIVAARDQRRPLGVAETKEVVAMLIAANADPTKNDGDNLSPLNRAVCANNLEVVEALIDAGTAFTKSAETPLYRACAENYYDIALALVVQTPHCAAGPTNPLYVACAKGHFNIIMLLLTNDWTPNSKDRHDLPTPLYMVCNSGLGKNTTKVVVENQFMMNKFMIVTEMLKMGADVNQVEPVHKITPLMASILSDGDNSAQIDQALLGTEGVDVNAVSSLGETALYMACASGNFKVAKMLMREGATIDARLDKNPISAAISAGLGPPENCYDKDGDYIPGSFDMMSVYRTFKAEDIIDLIETLPNTLLLEVINSGNLTPISAACNLLVSSADSGRNTTIASDILDHLIDMMEFQRAYFERSGGLSILCWRSNDINLGPANGYFSKLVFEATERLLKAGAPVDGQPGRAVPLIEAIKSMRILEKAVDCEYMFNTIECLLSSHADVNKTNSEGQTALITVCGLFKSKRGTYMMKNHGMTKIFDLLFKNEALHVGGDNGIFPLIEAARTGFYHAMRSIIKRGAKATDVDDRDGHTALSALAAYAPDDDYGYCFDAIDALLKEDGVDIDGLPGKLNPLIEAAKCENWHTMPFLIRQGASVDIMTEDGQTALSILVHTVYILERKPGLPAYKIRQSLEQISNIVCQMITKAAGAVRGTTNGLTPLTWAKNVEPSLTGIYEKYLKRLQDAILATNTTLGISRQKKGRINPWSRDAAFTAMLCGNLNRVGPPKNKKELIAWIVHGVPRLPTLVWRIIIDTLPYNMIGRHDSVRVNTRLMGGIFDEKGDDLVSALPTYDEFEALRNRAINAERLISNLLAGGQTNSEPIALRSRAINAEQLFLNLQAGQPITGRIQFDGAEPIDIASESESESEDGK